MPDLTARQEGFLNLMGESDELARQGFELLLKRQDFERFFEALRERGFFNPERNPASQPADPGYVRIPYWSPLDYLTAVATIAGERSDGLLAESVLQVVRTATTYRDGTGQRRDNYHTARQFAKILGAVPLASITPADLDLVPVWLDSRFDRSGVAYALDEGLLQRALASDAREHHLMAVAILRLCTAIRWETDKNQRDAAGAPEFVVEGYAIKDLLEHHVEALGRRVGRPAVELLQERVRELFDPQRRGGPSRLYRPVVEEHSQNHDWRTSENSLVSALRDVLLTWAEANPDDAVPLIFAMLADPSEMVRRVALYTIDQRWPAFAERFSAAIAPPLFEWGHLYELYNLLRAHFVEFTEPMKAATIDAIHRIPTRGAADAEEYRLNAQQRWLSAIAGHGYEPADAWFRELLADPRVEKLPEHPEFDIYVEAFWGPGPTPYSPPDLMAFAQEQVLVDRLNAFVEVDSWQGPSARALSDALEEATAAAPALFMSTLRFVLQLHSEYQYGLLAGFKKAWDASRDKPTDVEWDKVWPLLFVAFEQLLNDAAMWADDAPDRRSRTPNRLWIPPLVADFLDAGSRDDARAFPAELLPRAWALIRLLLNNSEAASEPSETDPMTQAINSPRGKAIEALFTYALRRCRLADTGTGGHREAWEEARPTFDAELAATQNGNYEFSTLAGAYIAHLYYMAPEWLEENVAQLFPQQFPANTMCAVSGLAFAPATRDIYLLLRDASVLTRVLPMRLSAREAHERLVQRVSLGYLWGIEDLDSPTWIPLFEEDALTITARFFASIRSRELADEQRTRIMTFWQRALEWAERQPRQPDKLLGALGALVVYVRSADGPERQLLLAVAPYVSVDHATHRFLEELLRLVAVSPEGVGQVLVSVLEAHVPRHDYRDHLKTLLRRLAEAGRREQAKQLAERARQLPGMADLFNHLGA